MLVAASARSLKTTIVLIGAINVILQRLHSLDLFPHQAYHVLHSSFPFCQQTDIIPIGLSTKSGFVNFVAVLAPDLSDSAFASLTFRSGLPNTTACSHTHKKDRLPVYC